MKQLVISFIIFNFTIINEQVFAQQIIPLPQQMQKEEGKFRLNKTTVLISDIKFNNEANQLLIQLKKRTGLSLLLGEKSSVTFNSITLKTVTTGIQSEGYKLMVSRDGITIEASDNAGMFYGCMSLLQLLDVENVPTLFSVKDTIYDISFVKINDYPRFKWRGLMLDCSRTFISPAYLKKTIDRLSFYKMNVLHLHLTDDQGWRLQIKSHPALTLIGGFFDKRYNEPNEFQGYYTQQDISEIIAYAEKKHVQIVPEIESPGHSRAALYAYPELSFKGEVSPIFPYFTHRRKTYRNVFDVGNPGTYALFKDILNEVTGLFPSPYVHLGGDEVLDEVLKNLWENCPKCLTLVKEKGLGDMSELQGYFMKQIALNVTKVGKRPIAWEEILDQKNYIDKNWIVMNWREIKTGLDAAKEGFDVVMTPATYTYLDLPYNQTSTKKVFEFDPYEGEQDNNLLKNHILGIQASFWSHIDRTESKMDYQIYPRLLALAERAWSSSNDTIYENFESRLEYHEKQWFKNLQIWIYGGLEFIGSD